MSGMKARGLDIPLGPPSSREWEGRASIPTEQIADFCRRHHIRRLSLFGSILRNDFRPDGDRPSDVDVLVEFEPGHTPGWEIVDIEEELSRLFGGRRVDMANPKYLNRRLRARILASAELCYESPDAEG
jgi:predicted nucleotidyltransferase